MTDGRTAGQPDGTHDPCMEVAPRPKNRSRKRHILWFNPPYNYTVTTNVGKEFLALLDKCFPPGNPLRKIFNRKNVKVSYSTTPNMAQIISGKNQKILRDNQKDKKTCSCPKDKKADCPLDQQCFSENIIYQATVSEPNKKTTYIGQTSVTFKARLAVHKQTFNDLSQDKTSRTALSKHVIKLKKKGLLDPEVTWKLIDRGKSFTPVTGVCQLCVKEAFYILFRPDLSELNSRSEIFSACFHIKPALLIKPRRKKNSPGIK